MACATPLNDNSVCFLTVRLRGFSDFLRTVSHIDTALACPTATFQCFEGEPLVSTCRAAAAHRPQAPGSCC